MKKKISTSLVLVIVLSFIVVTALALAQWNPFVEKVMDMEDDYGPFSNWSLSEKEELVADMDTYGIDTSSIPDVSNMSEDQAATVLSQAIDALFTGETASLHYSIMEKGLGFFDNWSLQDKAWYSSLLLEHSLVSGNDQVFVLPSANDFDENNIIAFANQQLITAYDISGDALTALSKAYFFFYYYDNPGVFYWHINYRDDNNVLKYQVNFKSDGDSTSVQVWHNLSESDMDTILANSAKQVENRAQLQDEEEQEKGPLVTWTLEDKAALYPMVYGIPNSAELSQEEAVTLAIQELRNQYNVSSGLLERLTPYSYFMINDGDHKYIINFFKDNDIDNGLSYSVELEAQTGSILKVYTAKNSNG